MENNVDNVEKNLNNKKMYIIIICLFVIIILLVGYIIYDVISDEKNNNILNNDIPKNTLSDDNQNDNISDKEDDIVNTNDINFPTENDSGVIIYNYLEELLDDDIKKQISYDKNAKGVKFNIKNIDFEYNCVEYYIQQDEYDDVSHCQKSRITVNKVVNIDFEFKQGDFFLITDKYIIVQKARRGTSEGNIEIYNYNGKKIYTIESTALMLIRYDENEVSYQEDFSKGPYEMKLFNNELHYIVREKSYGIASHKKLNMDTLQENVVQVYKAFVNQEDW